MTAWLCPYDGSDLTVSSGSTWFHRVCMKCGRRWLQNGSPWTVAGKGNKKKAVRV